MADASLPILPNDPRPLRVLFLDLNAYFASVEQQERPELRGRPVAVCPVMTDSSFVIAASYEAKACGVRTGTQIGEAKRLCPEIALVPARAPVYVHYHQAVIDAVESVLPVDRVCSIDEMQCRLIGQEREPEVARQLAQKIKRTIQGQAGECLTCSVGLAPNAFLAKLATDIQKPDGLVTLTVDDLDRRLRGLSLTEFAGINRRMQARLQAAGVFRSDDLLEASPERLRRAFGSVTGDRWYYLLRGYELPSPPAPRHSLGHSHVLPPELRDDAGCREVLLRLVHKAAARLRSLELWTSDMHAGVSGFERSWGAHTRLDPTQDTVSLVEALLRLWEGRAFSRPRTVSVTFTSLSPAGEVTPSLFDTSRDRAAFSRAVDAMNQKYGKNSVWLAAMQRGKDMASEKIAFHKTELFQEGKGDNVWPGTHQAAGA